MASDKAPLAGEGLKLTIPGEPQQELVPKPDGSFALKARSNVVFKFVTKEDGRVTGVQVRRPSGTVLAPKKT